MVKGDPWPSWWSKLFGPTFMLFFSPHGEEEHSRGWGRGEGVQKKKLRKKSRSSEMTAGLFLRSELNEHRV